MSLDGPLVLCARGSNATDAYETDRILNGRLTQLGIFDQALDATQIETLYQQASHPAKLLAVCLCSSEKGWHAGIP